VITMADFFWLVPLAMLGIFVWLLIRNGSLAGALLGGRIASTVGEIDLQSPAFASRVLRVQVLQPKSEAAPQVALTYVSKAPFGAGMVPIKLSQGQARELASLLERAANSEGVGQTGHWGNPAR
jgi:hypothetical protein